MTQIYDIAVIKTKAGDISTQNAELKKLIEEMGSIIDDMSRVWQDNAQTKFVKQFNELRPDLDRFCKGIDTLAERADTHAKTVEKNSEVL